MTKPKTLEQLRAEKERAETQLAQEQHKLERLENRKKYLEKGERTKRTHRLCNLGGTIESLAPEVKDLTRTEMTELMEHIFSLSEVQRAVRHMAIIKATDAEITALAKTPKAEIPAALAELRKPKQERQPRKAETASSKQTLSEISKSIQGHQRQLTAEEKTSLKASIDNRYQERAVANGSLMMCEVQGAKEDFIRRWNTIFKEYPDVFEDSDCRKIIYDLTEDAVQYLLKIKEKTL